MRVRPLNRSESRRAARRRSPEPPAAPSRPAPPAPEAPPQAERERERPRATAGGDAALVAERRYRDAGVPHDHATYRCGCGYIFEASVSTSVACPHCGSGQAW